MQMFPAVPIFVITAFATFVPAVKLTLDVSGRVLEQGYTVRKPAAAGSTTVTFNTLDDAVAGMPWRPRIATVVVDPAAAIPAPSDAPSMVNEPSN
jgi:hypothetical protein